MKALQLKIACTVCMLLLGVVCIQAQTIEIKGTVFDSKKETMPGASVYVKGTNIGVITDVNGKYAIKVPSTQSVLVFSFVGYVPQEVVVGNRNVVDIVLVDDAVLLKDVVVIGYGSVKKKDLTGAITSVGEDELQKGTVSPDRMLVGKVAGVQVTPSGGAPGSGSRIRIRGGASLTASNDPLIIIDGIPVENSGVSGSPSLLSTINPNDIESMNILKDASATAIYGSRASNGVIIITTKKAAYGQKVKVDFSTQFSLSSISDKLDLLSGDEIRDIVNNHPKSTSELKGLLGTYNTDWQDAIYQTAFSTDNNLSLSGTLKTIPYRVSLGYLDEDGILKTGNMERWSGSLNLNPRFFDNHLKIDASLKATRINNRFANTDAIQTAVSFDPTQPVKAEGFDKYDGYFTWLMPSGELKSQALTNPVLLLNTYSNTSNVSRVIATTQIDYKMHFLPELRANLNLGYDYSKGDGKTYVPAWAPQMASRGGKSQKYGNNKKNKLKKEVNMEIEKNKNIELKQEIINEKSQKNFLETTLGKTINTAIDIGIRALLPDFIDDQIINVKNNLIKNGLQEGIKKTIDDAVDIGKSAIGIITGNFENVNQMQTAVKTGGIIDGISTLLDTVVNKVQSKGLIDYNIARTIKEGKNIILNNVESNIEKTFTDQIKSVEYTNKYINNWRNYYENKNFEGMEKEYQKIKKELKNLVPMEKTINQARTIENLHILIKNNGQNFNLSNEAIELAEKLK